MARSYIGDDMEKNKEKVPKNGKGSNEIIMTNLKEEFNLWIEKADSDIKKVNVLMDAKQFDGALFYSQQAAEKALKALHILKGFGLIKTHDLTSLCRRLKAPRNIILHAQFLNPFENSSRYPDKEEYLLNKESAKDAIKSTKEIIKWCKL